jgi:hypothetical protein
LHRTAPYLLSEHPPYCPPSSAPITSFMADSAALYPHDMNACYDNDMHTRGSMFGSPSSAEKFFFF